MNRVIQGTCGIGMCCRRGDRCASACPCGRCGAARQYRGLHARRASGTTYGNGYSGFPIRSAQCCRRYGSSGRVRTPRQPLLLRVGSLDKAQRSPGRTHTRRLRDAAPDPGAATMSNSHFCVEQARVGVVWRSRPLHANKMAHEADVHHQLVRRHGILPVERRIICS
jgi:hypothetical protein